MPTSIQVKEAFGVLDACEATSKRSEKVRMLKARATNEVLMELFRMAYGENRYWVTPDPTWKKVKDRYAKGTPTARWKAFGYLCKSLSNRTVTGNDALDETQALLRYCPKAERRWYERVLLRDLEVGIAGETINLVWPGLLAPTSSFNGVMKAREYHDGDYGKRFKVYGEPKMDGLRVVCVVDSKGVPTLYTTGGKVIEHLHHITARIKGLCLKEQVLDGEMVVWNDDHTLTDWRRTLSLAKPRKHITAEMAKDIIRLVEYHVFDLVPLADYRAGACETPLHLRKMGLAAMFGNKARLGSLVRVPRKILRNQGEVNEFYQGCLSRGFEGVIIKDPKGVYKAKGHRGYEWLKIKPTEDVSGRIIGFKIGQKRHARVSQAAAKRVSKLLAPFGKVHTTKRALSVPRPPDVEDISRVMDQLKPDERQRLGWNDKRLKFRLAPRLGAFLVVSETGDTVEVGGALSDPQREEFWDKRATLKNKWIDYVQQQDAGDVGASRFPRFLRFRVEGDK